MEDICLNYFKSFRSVLFPVSFASLLLFLLSEVISYFSILI